MFIIALDLEASDLAQERDFYTQTLGLPLRQATADTFTVQAGATRLTFRSSSQRSPHYHFAFTVPVNKWRQAKSWLTARTTLLASGGQDEFESVRVRARNAYFSDPAGNILEFIAREDLPTTAGEDFGPHDVVHISEIGLVVHDVPTMVTQLTTNLGVEVYRGSLSARFAQIGDINGVLVIVKKGRLWAPDERQPAVVAPVRVTILGAIPHRVTLDPYPYALEIAPLR